MAQAMQPQLVELDGGTWGQWLERVEPWLATTATLQGTFRKLLEDTVEDVTEPHWHAYLEEILKSARDHEAKIDDLYQAFDRERSGPGRLGSAAATLVAKGREAVGHAEGLAAGARGGSWRKLRELLLSNLDAISGFAVTEQLGLALGNPAVTDITVPIVTEKSEHQLQLQEMLLEMAANAILYQRDT
jgi:hypothetical protein